MNQITYAISSVLFLSTVIGVVLVIYSIRHSQVPGAKYFALLCGSASVFIFGYGMEITSTTLAAARFWDNFKYLGGPFICLFSLFLAFDYTGNTKLLQSRIKLIAYILIPVSIILLKYTNEFHHLYYRSITFVSNGYFETLVKHKGPLYYYYMLYLTVTMVLASAIYIRTAINSSSVTHLPIMFMFLSSLLPWFAIYMNATNTAPLGIDYSAILLCPSSILYMLGIFKFRMLKTIPIARNAVFHHSKDGIIILDYNENIIDFNEAAKSIFEDLSDKSLNLKFHTLFPLWKGNDTFEFCLSNSGVVRNYSCESIQLKRKNNNILGWIIIISDITKLVSNQKQLEFHATYDSLTNIYNRRFFIEQFYHEFESSKQVAAPICLIMFDIDFFKNVNDHYGHQVGDEILKFVTEKSRACIRSSDIIARYGGEEFMILLPKTRINDAMALAERIRKQLESECWNGDGLKINVTASFGVTGIERYTEGISADALMKAADQALYSAKSNGRNTIAFQSIL